MRGRGRPLAIGHGYGNRRDLLEAALAVPLDMVEADVWFARGRLWARHERRLGPLPVLADWRKHAPHGLGPWALSLGPLYLRLDVHPLAVDEALARLDGRLWLLLDAKGEYSRRAALSFGRALGRLLEGCGRDGGVVVCGQNWRLLDVLREAVPGLAIRYSVQTAVQWARLWPRLDREPPPDGLCLHRSLATEETASLLRERGLGFYCWCINDAAELERVLALGAEGVISDRLDLLASLVRPPAG